MDPGSSDEHLFQSLSRSDLHDWGVEATNRLLCHFYGRLKVAGELECSSRFFTLRLAAPEVRQHEAAAGALRWAWIAPAVAVISLSCPPEPLHILSTLRCFSRHLIKAVKCMGCLFFLLMKPLHGGVQVAERFRLPSRRKFFLISCQTLEGHRFEDPPKFNSDATSHIQLRSLGPLNDLFFFLYPFDLTEFMDPLLES